jgi:hypothetical protein
MEISLLLAKVGKLKKATFCALILSLVILTSACGPVTPTPVATVFADCEWDGTAVAWLDANNNGIWDANEVPLIGVKFSVDGWSVWWIDNAFISKDIPTGGVGLAVWLAGCPDVSFKVCAEVPENYQPTTNICIVPEQRMNEILQFGFNEKQSLP